MRFEAKWGQGGPHADLLSRELVVTEPDDVDRLLAELSAEGATAAHLVHVDRPLTVDAEGYFGPPGAPVADHAVNVCVRDGFGYMTYFSPETDHVLVTLVGEPESPKAVCDQSEYDAGTGVLLDVLAKALKEFLATARQPTCVGWQEL